jgi:hypothetical protein
MKATIKQADCTRSARREKAFAQVALSVEQHLFDAVASELKLG